MDEPRVVFPFLMVDPHFPVYQNTVVVRSDIADPESVNRVLVDHVSQICPLGPVLADDGVTIADGFAADDLYTDQFLDPAIAL